MVIRKTNTNVYIQYGEAGSRTGFTHKTLIPRGTNFYPTGRSYHDGRYNWLEGQTQWLKDNNKKGGWIPEEYLTEVAQAASSEDERERRAMNWFWSIAGRSLDVDKVPHNQPEQCVDVPKHLCTYEFGGPLKAYGNGIDVAYNMAALPGWTRIKYVPGMQLFPLDVLSWGKPYGVDRKTKEVYGHTAVQLTYGTTPDVAQQDGFNSETVVHRKKLDNDGLLWVARPPVLIDTPAQGGLQPNTHTIKSGDTLWGIQMATGVKVPVLRQLNPGIDPENLAIGSTVRIS